MGKVGVTRIVAKVPERPGAFHASWRIHIDRQPNGFSASNAYPTRADLPDDVRAGLLAWLTGETEV